METRLREEARLAGPVPLWRILNLKVCSTHFRRVSLLPLMHVRSFLRRKVTRCESAECGI